jgi:hypothetical protein
MKEPFIIEINGTNQLINVSCEAEARYISKKVNGKIKGAFSVEDYKIINMINGIQLCAGLEFGAAHCRPIQS